MASDDELSRDLEPAGSYVEQVSDEPIPEPEIRARPAEKAEIPRGATTIINLAKKHGWEVLTTYARGPLLHASGTRVLRVVDSIRVRAHKGDRMVAATWVDKSKVEDGKELMSVLVVSPFKRIVKSDELRTILQT